MVYHEERFIIYLDNKPTTILVYGIFYTFISQNVQRTWQRSVIMPTGCNHPSYSICQTVLLQISEFTHLLYISYCLMRRALHNNNVGETQQPPNATIVHKAVGMSFLVECGWSCIYCDFLEMFFKFFFYFFKILHHKFDR